ncbi:MAG: divergent polysaccharide deacetylase family protein [Pseudomonadota bacterium]
MRPWGQYLAGLTLLLLSHSASAEISTGGAAASEPATPALVLIIDDIGNQRSRGLAVIELPGPLTIAVLPYTPHGADLAREAHARGQEVMLHAPMSNIGDEPLGEGALTAELDEAEFRRRLEAALATVPNVRGVNNHMGSYLTQQGLQMAWMMQVLRHHGLYFVDSRTSHLTVAARTAEAAGIPNLSRHVFLDNQRTAEAIAERFDAAIALAKAQGLAVAIGHPYPETIDYLREVLPGLQAEGIRLLTASEALGLDGEESEEEALAQSRTSIPRSAM